MFKIQPIIIYSALIHTKGLLDKMTPEEYLQNRPVLPEDYLPFIKNYLDGWDQGQLISSVNRYIAAGVSSGQSSADSMFKEKGICSTLANVIIFFLTRSWQVHAQSQQAAQGQIADAPPSLDYTFAAAFKKVALAHPKDVKTMGLFSFEELLCFIPDARAKDPKLQALYQQHMEQIKDLRQVNQSPKLIQLQQLALLHPKEIWRLLQLKKDFEEVINAVNQTEKRRLFYPQIVSDRLLQGGVSPEAYESGDLQTLNDSLPESVPGHFKEGQRALSIGTPEDVLACLMLMKPRGVANFACNQHRSIIWCDEQNRFFVYEPNKRTLYQAENPVKMAEYLCQRHSFAASGPSSQYVATVRWVKFNNPFVALSEPSAPEMAQLHQQFMAHLQERWNKLSPQTRYDLLIKMAYFDEHEMFQQLLPHFLQQINPREQRERLLVFLEESLHYNSFTVAGFLLEMVIKNKLSPDDVAKLTAHLIANNHMLGVSFLLTNYFEPQLQQLKALGSTDTLSPQQRSTIGSLRALVDLCIKQEKPDILRTLFQLQLSTSISIFPRENIKLLDLAAKTKHLPLLQIVWDNINRHEPSLDMRAQFLAALFKTCEVHQFKEGLLFIRNECSKIVTELSQIEASEQSEGQQFLHQLCIHIIASIAPDPEARRAPRAAEARAAPVHLLSDFRRGTYRPEGLDAEAPIHQLIGAMPKSEEEQRLVDWFGEMHTAIKRSDLITVNQLDKQENSLLHRIFQLWDKSPQHTQRFYELALAVIQHPDGQRSASQLNNRMELPFDILQKSTSIHLEAVRSLFQAQLDEMRRTSVGTYPHYNYLHHFMRDVKLRDIALRELVLTYGVQINEQITKEQIYKYGPLLAILMHDEAHAMRILPRFPASAINTPTLSYAFEHGKVDFIKHVLELHPQFDMQPFLKEIKNKLNVSEEARGFASALRSLIGTDVFPKQKEIVQLIQSHESSKHLPVVGSKPRAGDSTSLMYSAFGISDVVAVEWEDDLQHVIQKREQQLDLSTTSKVDEEEEHRVVSQFASH